MIEVEDAATMIITKKSLEEGEASSTAISYSVNSKFWLQIFGRGTFLVPALSLRSVSMAP
jgi:hypothetical protein